MMKKMCSHLEISFSFRFSGARRVEWKRRVENLFPSISFLALCRYFEHPLTSENGDFTTCSRADVVTTRWHKRDPSRREKSSSRITFFLQTPALWCCLFWWCLKIASLLVADVSKPGKVRKNRRTLPDHQFFMPPPAGGIRKSFSHSYLFHQSNALRNLKALSQVCVGVETDETGEKKR